jgi:predicted Fe-Mo cluster-binding NifX family protein
MKVALTVWDDRISPVFDSAHMLLIAEIKDNEVIKRQYMTFDPGIPLQLSNMLKGQDISVIICGAISEVPANRLEAAGMELIPFISGNIDEILEKYSRGIPINKEYIMPGCDEKEIRRQS